jgi:hypothetical protein
MVLLDYCRSRISGRHPGNPKKPEAVSAFQSTGNNVLKPTKYILAPNEALM